MKKIKPVRVTDTSSGSIWALLAGASLITLYFNKTAYDPFNTPKLIILLITSGWLLGHIIDHYRNKSVRIRSRDFVYLAISGIFLFFLSISLFFTDIFLIGLLGDTQRRNGFLSYLALTIILLFTAVKINYFYVIRMIKVSILVGLILCGYGLLQITGNDFVQWNNPYNSMITTVGNPNFASSLLALMLLTALFAMFIQSINIIYKIVGVVIIILGLALIIDSQSRQGLLVAFFSIIFYLVTYFYFVLRRFRLALIAISASLILFTILGMLQMGPLSSVLYKGSVSVRGYYWRAAFEMIKDHPFSGVGLDRYGSFFKEYREVGYPLNYGFEITSSNAHNVFLQLFSTGGIFLGFSYLALLILIFMTGMQNLKNSQGDFQKINQLLLATWVGFQAQALISIDNIGISIWGWLFGGCILGLGRLSAGDTSVAMNRDIQSAGKSAVKLFQPAVSICVLIPTLLFSSNLHRIESHTYLTKAYADPRNLQNKPIVYDYAQKVINNRLSDPFYKLTVSLSMVDMGFIEEAHNAIVTLHNKDPRNLDVLHWLSDYERYNKNLDQEINYRTQIISLDPWNADNYLELGRLYLQNNNYVNMEQMKKKILSFAADTDAGKRAQAELTAIG
jgi:O-antigen ligase